MAPIISATLCGITIACSFNDSLSYKEKHLKQIVILYYLCNVLAGVGVFLAAFFPVWYAWAYPISFLAYILFHIYLFRIVLLMTQNTSVDKIGAIHYLIPVGLALFLSVFLWILPIEERMRLIEILEIHAPAEQTFSYYVFRARYWMDASFSIYYTVWGLIYIYRYHRKMRLSSKAADSTEWELVLTTYCLFSLYSALTYLFLPTHEYGLSIWSIASAMILFVLHIELAYPIFVRRYQMFAPPVPPTEQRQYHGEITINKLESYFRKKKPYLNPDYKISDLVEALDVNRSVVSQFINRTYQVNFSRYVNRWRLEEVERLRKLPTYSDARLDKLVMDAGFSDAKHYRRVKQQEAAEKEELTRENGQGRMD
ncbi:MAG: hypothetical protein LBN06_04865 [Prevotellaceae bacterium]|nr:hypothetical protein [Prevotellaceae bacterium]